MSRYFVQLAYNGARYSGWQRQPNAESVQQTIEEAFSLILREKIAITGCGRTDTGVHATDYFAHFDFSGDFPRGFIGRINRFLPHDILIKQLFRTPADAHARFGAQRRSYRYDLVFTKDPFRKNTVSVFPFAERVDIEKLCATATLIGEFDAFAPFCKTKSDAKTMNCEIFRSEWVLADDHWTYHVTANRFLRGMVRLIVGCCLEVGQGKMALSAVRDALERQSNLPRSWSAPAEGLFLTDIVYSEPEKWEKLEFVNIDD